MKIRFWGVRGSIPSPGPRTARYGGNTTCIEVATDDGTLIILDGGTGATKYTVALPRGVYRTGRKLMATVSVDF